MNYPLLNVFLTMLWFFLWIMWLFLLFGVIGDIFRDDQLSGLGKAAWTVFVVLLPFLGVFVYLIARGSGMGERKSAQARARQEEFDTYVRQTAAASPAGGAQNPSEQLARLAQLKADGALSETEYDRAKAKILA
ncbi:SHOCT domain-containing protein [Actinospica durhamensis]|uniref:SHOCT domain-containing protein n=1 Tax=Actinospica durhamensis TaxID=1508375 RepID=A0A941ERJ1_9ACTN|nr:SHOCT domain-containing protein [Actinospica durhamensis]MBR7836155.1 SHOCT domain-containing protein [Actinospica durhamensis]